MINFYSVHARLFPHQRWHSSAGLTMRLLNASTLNLDFFSDAETPPYAILSHRWGKGEVLMQDMVAHDRNRMPAWPKIEMCCLQALNNNLNYVWIDTCYIDRSSSAELSEAINSMYRWYSHAEICYAYVSYIDQFKYRKPDQDVVDKIGLAIQISFP